MVRFCLRLFYRLITRLPIFHPFLLFFLFFVIIASLSIFGKIFLLIFLTKKGNTHTHTRWFCTCFGSFFGCFFFVLYFLLASRTTAVLTGRVPCSACCHNALRLGVFASLVHFSFPLLVSWLLALLCLRRGAFFLVRSMWVKEGEKSHSEN